MIKTIIHMIISIGVIIRLITMCFKIKEKDHNIQTQQYFYSCRIILYHYGLHVSTPIESSSGPQDVDPDIRTFTALWDP